MVTFLNYLLQAFTIVIAQVHGDYVTPTDVDTIFKGAREFTGQLASLQMDGYGTFCTGSIISEFVILTAASCFTRFIPHYVRIHSPYTWKEGRQLSVLRIDLHHAFSNNTLENDIALVEVKESTLSNAKFEFMRLFEQNENVVEGKTAFVLGWGLIQRDGSRPSELKRLDLQIVSPRQCRYTSSEQSQICTYSSGRGTCNGDEGGPLIVDGRQAGIVSTIQCVDARSGSGSQGFIPGLFTNVASYREWINSRVLAMLNERLKDSNMDRLPKPIGNYESHAPQSRNDTMRRRIQATKSDWAGLETELLEIRTAEEQLRLREQNLSKRLQDYYTRAGQRNGGILSAWVDSLRNNDKKKNRCD